MVKPYKPRRGSIAYRMFHLKRGQSMWSERIRSTNSEVQRLNIRFPEREYIGRGHTAISDRGQTVVRLMRVTRIR